MEDLSMDLLAIIKYLKEISVGVYNLEKSKIT